MGIARSGLELFMEQRHSEKNHDDIVTATISYPTGNMMVDYMNGQRIDVYDENDNLIMQYDSVGIEDGKMVSIIADPGLGKTTIAQQSAVSIASRYLNSFVIHEDAEQSSNLNRVRNITGVSTKWIKNHYVLIQDTHTESFVSRIMDHVKTKLNNRKEFEYDTGLKDMFGNNIKHLIPTVVILDSLAVMRSEEGSFDASGKSKIKDDIDNATGNMYAARNAKITSEMFKQIIPFLKKANIILLVINQINRKINTGFVPQARDLVGLGENETISGGRAVLYLSNNLIRFKNKGMLKPDKDYGINGNIIEATYLKSRSAATNVPFDLIFDKQKGYSSALSLLHMLIKENVCKKSGKGYYLKPYKDIIFTKKTFIQTAKEHPELVVALYDLSLPILQRHLSHEKPDSFNDDDEDSYDDIINMLNAE